MAMRPQVILTIISGDLKDKQIVFDESTSYTIGRAKNCNLCFADSDLNSGISRYHCLLEIDPPRVYIRDLGSTNGTIVNDRFLDELGLPDSPANTATNSANYQLKSGDRINVGETVIQVEILPSEVESPIEVSNSNDKTDKKSLKGLAIKGASWTILGYGLSQTLRFASNLILTRLLTPDLFGLMTLINVIYVGLNLFSDFGINQNIIQNPRGEERSFLNTAWTIQILRGIALWVICLIIAVPTARFYGEQQLLWLIPIVGFNTVIVGFQSTSLALVNRKLILGKLTILDLSVYILQITITIIWAKISPTIWALVIAGLISSLSKTIASHFLIPNHKDKLGWDKSVRDEILRFGSGIFLSTMTGFIGTQADKIILGKVFSIETLGIYTIAFTLSDIPRQVIGRIAGLVIFPLVSQQADIPRDALSIKLLKPRRILLLVSALSLPFVVGFGDVFISHAYDSRYYEAGWMLRLLALGIWQTILYRTNGAILLALGNTFYGAVGGFCTMIVMTLGLSTILHFNGLLGGITLIAFADLPQYFVLNYGLLKERINFFRQDAKYTLLFLVLLGVIEGFRSLILD